MSRALRALVTLRKKLNQNVLRTAIQGYFPNVSIPKDGLLDFLEEVILLNVFWDERLNWQLNSCVITDIE